MEWGTDVNNHLVSLQDDTSGFELNPSGQSSRDGHWIEMLLKFPTEALVRNVQTRWALTYAGEVALPTTINETEYENSYVCSTYSGCVLYPQSEVKKIDNALVQICILALVKGMGPPLRAARINRVVCVNNWLLSTNLYSTFDLELVPELTKLLTRRFPTHAIAFRSLNNVSNGPLLERLNAEGYLLAPSRQVYFFDGESGEFLSKQNNVWDQKLLKTTDYTIVEHDELKATEADRIEELYRLLYIDKYSPHNPQFTSLMLDECRRRRLLTMWGLRNANGGLDGILGTFDREGVMTAPVVGYDTALPKELGLYRILMAIALREASNRKLRLNLSSGASHFKRIRGGVPSIEYTAVYCRHLSMPCRLAWQVLAGLTRYVGEPILRKYQL
jgi:Acetyltransferase (GNAT) domain